MERIVSTCTFGDSSESVIHSIHRYFMASRLLLLPCSDRNLGSIFTDFNGLITIIGLSIIAIRRIRPFQEFTIFLQDSLPSLVSQTCSWNIVVPSLLYSVFPQLFVREQFTPNIFQCPTELQLFSLHLKGHLSMIQTEFALLHLIFLSIRHLHNMRLYKGLLA